MEKISLEYQQRHAAAAASALVAPLIFFFVLFFQLFDKYLSDLKKKAAVNEKDVQLRAEIKQLLKEAATLSEPSTFAQSAKLRRMAAAKERELARSQESANKEIKPKVVLFDKMLMISKVLTYLIFIVWFWRIPVATISKELVQPFGRFLSLKTGRSCSDTVMVNQQLLVYIFLRGFFYFDNVFERSKDSRCLVSFLAVVLLFSQFSRNRRLSLVRSFIL